MVRILARLLVGIALIGVGWSVGRAQATAPDFELVIYGAPGDTEVKCRSGCKLSYRETAAPVDPKTAKDSVGMGCGTGRCEMFAAGWVQR